ncbi:Fe-S metabolism associated domain, SufE-like [Dillenia turbinata]|uniref:Fe-S metabolism associated domain, SufE-like n=1 Tax=Dillenia turbinata TaxID=194707 RepID=A0AAN8ZEC4_9MAGN
MSICPSFGLITTKVPIPLFSSKTQFPKSLISSSPNLFFSKPLTIQRIHIDPSYSSSSPSSSAPTSSSSLTPQPIEELPPKLQEIIKLFQAVPDSRAKYEQLLFYGKNLTPLDNKFKITENKVKGCVSQVWVRAYLDSDKNVYFEADSDSVLTKGLAALLVQGLSGRPVSEILRVSPDFVTLLGLQQSLTPSRNNGFLNMLKMMQKKALELFVESEKSSEAGGSDAEKVENPVGSLSSDLNASSSDGILNSGLSSEVGASDLGLNSSAPSLGGRGERIREILDRELKPVELKIEDISYQHAGHAGVRGSDGETHFNIKVVSEEFEGKSLVKRHRSIYSLLQEELQNGLHALSIEAKTPSEVNAR